MASSRAKKRLFWIGILIAVAGGTLIAWQPGNLRLPDRWNPWAPLDLESAQEPFLRWKLARVTEDPEACRAFLTRTAIHARFLEDKVTGPDCGFSNAVMVSGIADVTAEPFSMSCRAVVSLAFWEKHVLQPAAERHFGSSVERLEHFGSYACRGIYGRESARRSQHATADALDVAGIILADGTRITVARDWEGTSAERAFLEDLHAGACRYFDAVLGPEYNAAHRDHFHVDRGRARICR